MMPVPTEILVALISAVSAVLVAGVAAVSSIVANRKIDRVRVDTKVIRNETRNAHDPDRPMRHDIDTLLRRSADNSRVIDTLLERSTTSSKGMQRVEKDIGGMRAELRALHDTDRGLNDKVDVLKDDYHKHVEWSNRVVQQLIESNPEGKNT